MFEDMNTQPATEQTKTRLENVVTALLSDKLSG